MTDPVNYTGSILICKRPGIDLDAHQAERTNTVKDKCADCKTELYVMKKNLGRGLILLCQPCATRRIAAQNETVVILGGEVIGSDHEAEIHRAALELDKGERNAN